MIIKPALMAIIIAACVCCSCTRVTQTPDGGIDIMNLDIQQGVAFDIRIIQDVYGPPNIIDTKQNGLIYITQYLFETDFLWYDSTPDKAERWYLILRPSDIDKMYYGERRSQIYHAEFTNNALDGDEKKELHIPPLPKSANDIHWDKTKLEE